MTTFTAKELSKALVIWWEMLSLKLHQPPPN